MLGDQPADNNNNLFTGAICYEHALPFRDPVLLSNKECRHLFCRKEIESVAKEDGKIPCPSCRRLSENVEPITMDGFVFRMFQSTVVACPKECGWKGEVMNHEKHYQNCEKFKCECGAVVMLPMEIEEHKRDECPETIMECENFALGCKKRVARHNLLTHQADCPKRLVACSFPNCAHRCSFDQMEKHVKSSKDEHLQLSLEALEELRAQSEKDRKALETETADLRNTVDGFKDQLAALERSQRAIENAKWPPVILDVPLSKSWLKKGPTDEEAERGFSINGHDFKVKLKRNQADYLALYVHYEGPSPGIRVKFSAKLVHSQTPAESLRCELVSHGEGYGWVTFAPWPTQAAVKTLDGESYCVVEMRVFVNCMLLHRSDDVVDLGLEAPWPGCPF